MNWVRFIVSTSVEASESIANYFFEIDAIGVELKESTSKTTSIIAYFPLDERVNTRVENLRKFISLLPSWGIDSQSTKIDLENVESEDWEQAWKSSYSPQRIGDQLYIVPSWHDVSGNQNDIVIKIDPGMAFGTGYHPTTRLSLRLIEKTIKPNSIVADIGTGSGILSIASIKLGASRVDAIEIDPSAIPVAEENFSINNVSSQVHLYERDGLGIIDGVYDLIVGNMLTKSILPLIPQCISRCNPDGSLIFSGILSTELDLIQKTLYENGFECKQILEEMEGGVVWLGILAGFLS
ncbi:50S ribosomal protein L11 methyltransferase [Candidatus Poribacteria bacterium]|nr:MAG: 50S ribosomal protein L11 methyltransferase [Candidatus Poribacteria bacterium]